MLNVGQGAEFANGTVIKLDDLDEEIYREPRTRGKRGSKMRREVLVQARVQFPDAMCKETIVTLALADTGSELVAIGGYELFQNIPLEDAPHPIGMSSWEVQSFYSVPARKRQRSGGCPLPLGISGGRGARYQFSRQ